jgi:choline dehydrogenase-like flavoprotein
MNAPIVVVGSGASGVHFALSLLRQGWRVTMLDVGRSGADPVVPTATMTGLKDTLADPAAYFLGSGFGGVLLPGDDAEYYGIPPSKDYVFDPVPEFQFSSSGFAPLFSFAQGGLAQTWTAGCYPFNADELEDFPFRYGDLAPHYYEVARLIGITGSADDLTRFMPLHDHLQPPLRLDQHSDRLLRAYENRRARLNTQGAYIGRTRVATLSHSLGSRQPCAYLGRCLWGCPHGALYTPLQTLQECRQFPGFEYIPGVEVTHFRIGAGSRAVSVLARGVDDRREHEFPVERLALAAGALLSTKIFLTSVFRGTGERIRLRGLMDNRQILVPFLNLGMIGQPFAGESYQYHLLGMGLETEPRRHYIHGQITTLKTGLTHPIVQRLPFDLATSNWVMRATHAALGIVNVNLHDTRRDENYVELSDEGDLPRLRIHYMPQSGERARIADATRRVRRVLRALGCIVPPGMAHVRPMGASVHYTGTIPMTRAAAPFTTTEYCQSRDFENVFLVDGATFPFLPAKNVTFTLMANAVRVAHAAFS